MQDNIIGYADRVRSLKRSDPKLTIGQCVQVFLESLPHQSLVLLGRSADDLMRIIELEQQRRIEQENEGQRMVVAGVIE